jgi:hypothetical protein
MSKRYSVSLKVFSSICGVAVSIHSNNSELQFTEGGHTGLVNNVLNVSPQEEMKWRNIGLARRPRNWFIAPNPAHVKKFSDNTSPMWGCQKRQACSSCLAFCSIDSKDNKNFLSYIFIFHQQFYFEFPGLKIIGHGNSDNNFESPCIIVTVYNDSPSLRTTLSQINLLHNLKIPFYKARLHYSLYAAQNIQFSRDFPTNIE